jgi:hypothetical protein
MVPSENAPQVFSNEWSCQVSTILIFYAISVRVPPLVTQAPSVSEELKDSVSTILFSINVLQMKSALHLPCVGLNTDDGEKNPHS